MLRIYLLTLVSVSGLIGANEYCERQNGKGLLARTGVERYLDRQFGSPSASISRPLDARVCKFLLRGIDRDNAGGCQ